jgi:hypothetical protein
MVIIASGRWCRIVRASDKIDKLVLVVHGVGDPTPGSTVSSLARSLADSDSPFLQQQEAIWLQETSEDNKFLSTYPTYRCRIQTKTSTIELAEVYWGDLSRVCHGWLGTVVGLFQILFGFRYVAYAAADQPGFFALGLKRLGRAVERILQGPVMAITTVLAALTIVLCANEMIWKDAFRETGWSRVLVLFSCLVAYAVASLGWRQTRIRAFERYWFWVRVTSFFIGAVCVLRWLYLDPQGGSPFEARFPGMLWYCRLLVCLLGMLWTTEIFLLLLIAICWVGAAMNQRANRRMIQVAALLPALSVGLWSHCLILFWLLAADRIEKFVGVSGLRDVFADMIPLLGVQFLMSGLIGGSVLLGVLRYVLWRSKKTIADFENGARAPRLIVNNAVLFVLAVSAGLGSSLVLTTQYIEFTGHGYDRIWFGKVLVECNKYALSLLLPFGFLVGFVLPRLRPVFGIVLEIVNHFVFRSREQKDGLQFDDQFDIARTTFENGNLFFARREVVLGRMKRVVRHYASQVQAEGKPVELIVIGHSQGTMVAIEVLNSTDMDCLDRFERISLVTMGSPFTHLYQHYFPKFYPELASSFWRSLQQRVECWFNIFRIDDPVGTEIDFPDGFLGGSRFAPSKGCWLPSGSQNFPVGCRGHMNYWNDREVLGILKSEIFRSNWDWDLNRGSTPAQKAA